MIRDRLPRDPSFRNTHDNGNKTCDLLAKDIGGACEARLVNPVDLLNGCQEYGELFEAETVAIHFHNGRVHDNRLAIGINVHKRKRALLRLGAGPTRFTGRRRRRRKLWCLVHVLRIERTRTVRDGAGDGIPAVTTERA